MEMVNNERSSISEQDLQIVDAMENALAEFFNNMLSTIAQFKIYPRDELLDHYENVFREMAKQYEQNCEMVEWEDMSKVSDITRELRRQKRNVADDVVELRRRVNAVVDAWKEDCGYIEVTE